jgi:hypothetical protein
VPFGLVKEPEEVEILRIAVPALRDVLEKSPGMLIAVLNQVSSNAA